MKKTTLTILSLFFLILIGALSYWYFFMRAVSPTIQGNPKNPSTGFVPINRPFGDTGNTTGNNGIKNSGTSTPAIVENKPIPKLRLLSDTPVGGYGASTTKSVTAIRWVDRGRGNIFEAKSDTLNIATLSNTILPRVYESIWNKNLTAFVGTLLSDGATTPTNVYAELKRQSLSNASTTANSVNLTPYNLKGKNLPDNVIAITTSPNKDRLFMLTNEAGKGVGYVATIDGKSIVQIFTTPLTQLNVEWPEENTIAITTKGSVTQNGYLYFVSPKTGVWKKILGPIQGMSAKVSHDAHFAIVSAPGEKNIVSTTIYDIAKGTNIDAIIHTLADKCAWGNFYKNLFYCGVPAQPVSAVYPDDWYKGSISFNDKIWQVNASTGELHLISSIVDQSDRVIDTFNLGLDDKDNFLIFMNKTDLSLWSLDLIETQ